MVIFHILPLSKFERVVAVGEDNGRELVFVVQEVAAMEVSDGNLMLTPEGRYTKIRYTCQWMPAQ